MICRLALAVGVVCVASALGVTPTNDPKPSVTGPDLSKYATADELWAFVEKQKRGPSERPKSREDARRMMTDYLRGVRTAAEEFIQRYPNDARFWDAKLLQLQASADLASLEGNHLPPSEYEAKLNQVVTATNASQQARADARIGLIEHHFRSRDRSDKNAETAAALDGEIEAFQKDFPGDERSEQLLLLRAKLNEKSDPAKAEALLRQAARSKDPELAQMAQVQVNMKDLRSKPLELKFTALDGSTVDLGALRGKVVVIDFWATWCGPCVVEMPKMVSTYKKYKDRGFEIVGISLDHNKEKLLQFMQQKGVTWPQYFDGKGWENEISSRYGIDGIPVVWIVDKKGFVRDTEGRADLVAQIEKLLAE